MEFSESTGGLQAPLPEAGEEDPGSPPLLFAGFWPKLSCTESVGCCAMSSMYWATLSCARRIRSLPASDCRSTGSIRWRHASL